MQRETLEVVFLANKPQYENGNGVSSRPKSFNAIPYISRFPEFQDSALHEELKNEEIHDNHKIKV